MSRYALHFGCFAENPYQFLRIPMRKVRVVEGIWPQPHMKGAKARMLSLFNSKNKRLEVQELAEPVAKVTAVKDI